MRTFGLGALLLGAIVSGGCCGHYVQVTVNVSREVGNIEIPAPEVVRTRTYPEKLPSLRKASIFFLQSETGMTGGREYVDLPEIRELERSFVRGGFDVLEVRQISKVQLEKDLERKDIASAGSDFIVIVYSIRPRAADLNTVRTQGEVLFDYGCELGSLLPSTPAEIDAAIGREHAMRNLFADASKRRDEEIEKANSELPIAFVEAKLIETKTREVLVFYKAFTLLEEERPTEREIENIDLGTFAFRNGRFQRHVERLAAEKRDLYGETSASRVHKADVGRLTKKDLHRIRVACDALVSAIKRAE